MEKFLFTDGTNGVTEVHSIAALQTLIESTEHPEKIQIWLFSSTEWISYPTFRKQAKPVTKKEKPVTVITDPMPVSSTGRRWLKKMSYITLIAAGIFLVFNFTKIKWEKADPLNSAAARPDNVPVMDIDSLISEIEDIRGVSLDRSTRTNLRLRNTWPDRIALNLHSERETSNAVTRFFNVDISIDNTTGFNLDNAVVKLQVWKNNKVNSTDTFSFKNIRYDKVLKRPLTALYYGDSISVTFESIMAKAFNFCYSAATKNNSGNYNDRWFCRE